MPSASCYQLPLFPPEKHCALCGQWRELSAFTRDKRAPDGLQAWCKACRNACYVAYRRGYRMKIAVPTGMKLCAPCQTLLPVDCFGHNRAAKDGRQSYCKACRSRLSRHERAGRRGGRRGGQIRSQSKRLALMPAQKRCPSCGEAKPCIAFYSVPSRPDGLAGVCRECAKAGTRAQLHKYRDRYIAAKKAWPATHPTFNRDYLRRWLAANPTKNATYHHRRRDRERGTVADLTRAQWHTHLAAIGHRCPRCGRAFSAALPPTKDHIVPVSQGGGLTIGNVQALCKACSSAKHTRTTDYRPPELREACNTPSVCVTSLR